MIVRTIRVYKYLYDKIKVMAEYNNISINALMIELMEIGYLEKEKLYHRKH